MKRLIQLTVALLLGLTASAQTQQGYIRTLGRPEQKGEALGGVSIRVKGEHNAIVSLDDGSFSLPLPGKKNGDPYSLQQVQKKGYELNENDIIGRRLAFSDKVLLEIVMVSSAQLQADKQRIEDNAYKTAEKNYKAKSALIEQQLQDSIITIQQYREMILDLQDKFEKYQSLIDGLAEHYAHTDYDLLDEKDREINLCIENGDLERADSLILLLFDPISVLKRNKEALASIEQQINQAQGILDQANEDMAVVLKQQEKDAEYLYQLYTIALARYDNEKSQQYIETRAALDTTNPAWQFDAAYFFHKQNNFNLAEKYYFNALKIRRQLVKDNPQNYEYQLDVVSTINNLASLYILTKCFKESETMFLEAFDICKKLSSEKYRGNYSVAITTLSNLAGLYSMTGRFSESETIYLTILELYRELANDNSQENNIEFDIAKTLNNLAVIYTQTQRFEESEAMYLEALDIFKRLLNQSNPQNYDSEMAQILCNLANIYYITQRYSESEVKYLESLDIFRRLAKSNPQAFEPILVKTLYNLACLYSDIERQLESETLHLESLEILRRLMIDSPQAYVSDYEKTLKSLATLYNDDQRLTEYEAIQLETLELYRQLALSDPQAYESVLAVIQYNLGSLYQNTKHYEESVAHSKEALVLLQHLAQIDPQKYESDLVYILGFLSYRCIMTQQFAEAEQYATEALYMDIKQFWIVYNYAAALLFGGDYDTAEAIYSHFKEKKKDRFLQTLAEFEDAGVIPKERMADVERIRKLLTEDGN